MSPSILKLELLFTSGEPSAPGNQLYLRGQDIGRKGMLFDPETGGLCSGAVYLQSPAAAYFEQGMNHRDSHGNIIARARFVYAYTAEYPKTISVFREVPDDSSFDADSDLVGTSVVATVDILVGHWKISQRVVRHAQHVEQLPDTVRKVNLIHDSKELEVINDDSEERITGSITAGGKSIIFANDNTKLLFLGGGVMARVSFSAPGASGSFTIEGRWLVDENTVLSVCRRYNGASWLGTWYATERRLS